MSKNKVEPTSPAASQGGPNSKESKTETTVKEKKEEKLNKEIINRPNISQKNGKKPIIELQHVFKSFIVGKDNIAVLKDINLKVNQKEFIIILGYSGSGKSTLLNTILGLEPPTSGKIVINGEDITKISANKLARFRYRTYGIVFQRADWIRSLNVINNVAFPLAIVNTPRKKRMDLALKILNDIGIGDHANYYPTELSGGQQQKVCLARALITDPPIIVADEPTGNLDTDSAERVMQTFKDLNDNLQKTVIMVTHNVDYVRFGTRTIYIRDGKILEGTQSYFKTA